MKKLIALLLVLVMVAGLVACAGSNDETKGNDTTNTENTADSNGDSNTGSGEPIYIGLSAKITGAMGEGIGWQAKSPTGRLQDLAPFPIVVAYIPEDGQIVTDKIMNCRFKKNARNWKEGDTRQLVDLELVPSHIKWHNK